MKFFSKLADFFKNEPNLKALFAKIPPEERKTLSPHERGKLRRNRNLFFFLFFPLAVFYMEVVFHFAIYGQLPVVTLLILLTFSLGFGFFINAVALLMPLKINRGFTLFMTVLVTLVIEAQYVCFRFFGWFFTISIIDMAGAAVGGFTDSTLSTINNSWFGILLILVPAAIFIAKYKKYAPSFAPTMSFRAYLFVLALLLHLLGVGAVSLDRSDFGNNHYYKNEFSATEAVKRFGVVTDMCLDLKSTIFGMGTHHDHIGDVDNPFVEITTTAEIQSTAPETTAQAEPPKPVEYGENKMDIDFEALAEGETNADIKAMHQFFGSLTPTKKNQYTGMFEGKNLIFLTLEGFSYKVIDKELTPTLYKMANEGFVFNNFYTSLWGGSTATGEYAAMTGNFHQSAKCLQWSGDNLMKFTLGNQLRALGYETFAFHNNSYTYYSRDKSHPNMGYEWIAIDNGLEMTSCWPRSDLEMAEVTLPYYIDSEKPFHVYYMTVSGHANYTYAGNTMSKRHRDVYEHLPYSDNVKAYFACQYEVELMLTELVRALEAAGKLDDTVFVMSSDHYPYGLGDEDLAELYGYDVNGVRRHLDILKNSCIIWCNDMEEPIIVDTPCSSVDIIPTVSNLFGLEYDSRLLMGTDVLSGADPLVILNCLFDGPSWCWTNKYGTYNSSTKKFTPAEGFEATEEEISAYVKQINNLLWAKRRYSPMILDKDYYRYIFN